MNDLVRQMNRRQAKGIYSIFTDGMRIRWAICAFRIAGKVKEDVLLLQITELNTRRIQPFLKALLAEGSIDGRVFRHILLGDPAENVLTAARNLGWSIRVQEGYTRAWVDAEQPSLFQP